APVPVWAPRSISPSGFLIGASVHSVAEARTAEPEGADFLFFGPVYDTASKRQYGPAQGLAALERVTSTVRLPVFAGGGTTPERVPGGIAAGPPGGAVIGAILGAGRPGEVVSEFLDRLGGA